MHEICMILNSYYKGRNKWDQNILGQQSMNTRMLDGTKPVNNRAGFRVGNVPTCNEKRDFQGHGQPKGLSIQGYVRN